MPTEPQEHLHTHTIKDDRISTGAGLTWLATAVMVAAGVLAGTMDWRCGDRQSFKGCQRWAEGSALDNVSATERAARMARCDAEAAAQSEAE